MKMSVDPADKTNFVQSLMHMIKGNLGTGILAMPASFSHCGLVTASIGLPLLCLIATYCVHLLVRSSQHLESKMKWAQLDYAQLAKGSFKTGPEWMRPYSGALGRLVDGVLILCQVGICCVYLVFIVDNVHAILTSYQLIGHLHPRLLYLALLPLVLLLSFVRTLRRLAIASACANLLQVVGLSIVMEFLVREMPREPQVELFRPAREVALGFGSAMFAFEGISVVLPIYTRMKRRHQMGGLFGIINLSYFLLLCLYLLVGLLGYLRYGNHVAGSITLSLPREPLYDLVRAIFTTSLFLSYPLQFYVPQAIIFGWLSAKLNLDPVDQPAHQLADHHTAHATTTQSMLHNTTRAEEGAVKKHAEVGAAAEAAEAAEALAARKLKYEYLCRTLLVLFTFLMAISVPRLNLMMDFFGSISGTALSVTLPPLIHLAAFWEDTSGWSRWLMALSDGAIILFGLFASANGSYISLVEIVHSFNNYPLEW